MSLSPNFDTDIPTPTPVPNTTRHTLRVGCPWKCCKGTKRSQKRGTAAAVAVAGNVRHITIMNQGSTTNIHRCMRKGDPAHRVTVLKKWRLRDGVACFRPVVVRKPNAAVYTSCAKGNPVLVRKMHKGWWQVAEAVNGKARCARCAAEECTRKSSHKWVRLLPSGMQAPWSKTNRAHTPSNVVAFLEKAQKAHEEGHPVPYNALYVLDAETARRRLDTIAQKQSAHCSADLKT